MREITGLITGIKEALVGVWIKITHPQTAFQKAVRELAQAKVSFLDHQTHAEYFQHLVKYDLERIRRLQKYVKDNQDA